MYRGRLKRDLDLWASQGIIRTDAAEAMLAEYDARKSAFSIGTVLTMLAAVLLSASIAMVIAANWETIPRLARIVAVLAMIWIFHLGAALAVARGFVRLAGALLVLGAASFGGAIALVGQLYHLSGDAVQAALLWFAMTMLSAALFRSIALTTMAGVLLWSILVAVIDQSNFNWSAGYAGILVLSAMLLSALIAWTRAIHVQHFVYLLVLALLFWRYVANGGEGTALTIALVALLLFLAATLRASPLSPIAARIGPALPFYSLAACMMGLLFLHVDFDGDGLASVVLAVVTLGVAVLALVVSGRDNGAVRALAYACFSAEILYLSYETIDSMLETSGFFFISGFVVAALAFIAIRLEKLFSARAAERRGARP